MTSEIITYNKLAAVENIKIEPFDKSKRYTKPHRHSKYLELVYFTQGTGFHHMDLNSYKIAPPVVFLIKKEEVHHWEITSEPEGYVMIIKEDFLAHTLDKHINTQLLRLSENQKIEIHEEDAVICSLFDMLSQENKNPKSSVELIEGMLKALLSKILSYTQDITTVDKKDKMTQFVNLLNDCLKNNVAFYADQLHISAQNLNQICKRKLGKTASQIIADHMVQEIKRLLVYTNKSVGEIAFDLNFKDVSHFVKYFKRHTGLTPVQFKNAIQ
ncbi:AraC family transcriptional regulator [Ochrovirga pacifica]|uniref:AraC family transcriptional regulator n=1 Tax=Ochrovirga pacifica TaxID=1042376 RepID=UPI000255A7D1|nr:helix-turn-helix domain-containing protein [Ochrovirga pacifica]